MKNVKTKIFVTGSALVGMSAPAWAVMDVTAPTASIADAATAIGALGALVLAALVLARSFKWVRAAL